MIELVNIASGYDKEIINIDKMTFEKGMITSVIGKNGSGKTTLLKTAAGLLKSRGGSILTDGHELSSFKGKERAKRIAYLPQSLKELDMDVKTLVSHGRFPYSGKFGSLNEKDMDKITGAMEMAGVAAYADKKLKSLSGGERQRAYIAMIIAQDAEYMLFDEPCTYMDIKHRREFADIAETLKDMGKGVVLTLHDIPMSFDISDKIYVLKDGRVSAGGAPGELLKEKAALKDALDVTLKYAGKDDNRLYGYELCI